VLARRLRQAKDALEAELDLVALVQRSLLPSRLLDAPGLVLAADARTARRAGGDYYAAFPLDGGRTGLLIADASGHSAPATVLMAMVHAFAHVCPRRQDPGALLGFLDRALSTAGPRDAGAFVTAFAAVFDPGSRELRYARTGHPPPRLRPAAGGPVAALDAVGEPPLGLGLADPCAEVSVRLSAGDLLVCFTDGVSDAPGPDGGRFGCRRLDELIAAAPGEPGRAVEAITGAVSRFAGGIPPDDDCTLLVAWVR
jgi:sigma-B regulation protein RsbU (phosphoserine phosphatase)